LADGALVAATGAAFARWLHPRAAFAGIELANEPDISSFRGNESGYEATLSVWLSALEAAGVPGAVDAPVLAGTQWWPEMPAFLARLGPRLSAFVQHRYGLTACPSHAGPPTTDALLRVVPSWATANDTALLGAIAATGLPFLIGEGNTVSCNGSAGVSDVFASALYAMDASLSALGANITAFKWHGVGDESDHFFYQPFYYETRRLREPVFDQVHPRPMFLGLWAFSEAAPAGSVPLVVSVETSNTLLRAWALRTQDGAAATRTTIVVLHKDPSAGMVTARIVPVAPCASGAHGTLSRLLAGLDGASARAGSTWANLSFDGTVDGRPVGTRTTESVPCVGGEFLFDVPSLSAAVLVY